VFVLIETRPRIAKKTASDAPVRRWEILFVEKAIPDGVPRAGDEFERGIPKLPMCPGPQAGCGAHASAIVIRHKPSRIYAITMECVDVPPAMRRNGR
jgi:hypothetical protein